MKFKPTAYQGDSTLLAEFYSFEGKLLINSLFSRSIVFRQGTRVLQVLSWSIYRLDLLEGACDEKDALRAEVCTGIWYD